VRVLVTGGAGFVGTHLCLALRPRGHEIVTLGTQPICTYQVDIRDHDGVVVALGDARPDAVFHLAAIAHVPSADADPALTDAVNVGGTSSVLDGAARVGARTVVVSTGAVYGHQADGDRPITEEHATEPVGAYACSKAAAEQECRRRHGSQEIVRVRPFNQAGPGQSPDYVCSDFARQVAACEREGAPGRIEVGDLSAVRDFVDVRDAVVAYIDVCERGRAGEVYNVCSGTGVEVRAVLDTLIDLASVDVAVEVRRERLRAGEVSRYYGSAAKLERATGWRPGIALRQTLAAVLDDWRTRLDVDGPCR